MDPNQRMMVKIKRERRSQSRARHRVGVEAAQRSQKELYLYPSLWARQRRGGFVR